jgi:hypothetical protein
VIFDHIEWDEYNLDHATKRLTAAEIEQAIWNATSASRHRMEPDRRLIRSATNGGKRVIVIVQVVHDGVRPITGWEE